MRCECKYDRRALWIIGRDDRLHQLGCPLARKKGRMANIQDATYNLKAIPEGSWYTLQTAVGGALTAILIAVGVDNIQAGVIALAIAGLVRPIVGLFLPSPPTTGAQGDKST